MKTFLSKFINISSAISPYSSPKKKTYMKLVYHDTHFHWRMPGPEGLSGGVSTNSTILAIICVLQSPGLCLLVTLRLNANNQPDLPSYNKMLANF